MNSQVPKLSNPDATQPEKDDAAAEPADGGSDRDDSVAKQTTAASAEEASSEQDTRKAGAGQDRARPRRFRAIEGRSGAAGGGNAGAGAGPAAEQRKRMQRAGMGGAQARREDGLAPKPAPERKPAPMKPQPLGRADSPDPVRPPAQPAQIKTRHRGILALAFLLIVLPGIVSGVYLWKYAVDQYVSEAGFAIRTENAPSAFSFLGPLLGGGATSGNNMDILSSFLTSQQLVAKLDKELDLKKIFSKPANDPYFAFNPKGATIEDLVNYWSRMVVVNYNNSTGLMQLDVYAFTPQDAQTIAKAVLNESSTMINKMAEVSQADTTRYAKEALDEAKRKMDESTAALTAFRIKYNIVDPTQDVSSQGAVVNSLTQQLVKAQIELAALQQGASAASDPRVKALQQQIDIIQNRIAQEQQKVAAANGAGSKGYAAIVAEYEKLSTDQEFNQKAYTTAMATYDAAVASAQQQKVYLTTYEQPTLAEASTAPRRWLLLGAVMLIGFFAWAIITMVYYALRDRR